MNRPLWELPRPDDPVRTYQWGGYRLASRLRMHRLWSSEGRADVEFVWRADPPRDLPEVQGSWPVRWRDGSQTVLSVGTDASTARYELDGTGVYVLRPAEGRVDFHPAPGAEPMDAEHFLIHGVLALYAGLAGDVCLHTAALERDGRAVLVGGPSGAGKSHRSWTLIEQGWRLLADDYSVLRRTESGWLVSPQSRTLRLDVLDLEGSWDNRGKREAFVPACPDAVPVESLVLLTPEPDRAVSSLVLRSVATIHGGWRWLDAPARRRVVSQLSLLMQEVPVTCESRTPEEPWKF